MLTKKLQENTKNIKFIDTKLKSKNNKNIYYKNFNTIIEFQNNIISSKKVQKNNISQLNNCNIIWIIDGNDKKCPITIIKQNNEDILEFDEYKWKYENFIKKEKYIYVNINNFIYQFSPNNIKSNMITVNKPIYIDDFIKKLNDFNIDTIINPNSSLPQSKLYIMNQGAGSGKTFGIINKLDKEYFNLYENIIIVSQLHSAKYKIYEEFKKHEEQGLLINLKEIKKEPKGKKYIISYVNNNTSKDCILVIGTIDSLMYALADKTQNNLNKFEGYVQSIINENLDINDDNIFKYGINGMRLCKKTCLICDESQDMVDDYTKAIVKLMKNMYIDCYIIGDILQSLKFENNGIKYLLENDFKNENIEKITLPKINICRRFTDYRLINFVNTVINFNKYNLDNITPYKECNIDEEPILFIEGTPLYNGKSDDELAKEVEKIMNYYIYEVEQGRRPKDFLIITPFTTKNSLVDLLDIAIQEFWVNKNNDNEFKLYSVFHKSDEGQSINLEISKNATRIVSIHTSKGDGRPVVFVIGLEENALLKFSETNNNIVYESLIHVAFTRMEEKLYIRIICNGDDIYKRLMKYRNENNMQLSYPIFKISSKNKYNTLINMIKTETNYKIIKENIISKTTYLDFDYDKNVDKRLIDMSHHSIRYATMLMYLYNKIIFYNKSKKDSTKKQIKAKYYEMEKILNKDIVPIIKYQDYIKILKDNSNKDNEDKKIAILKYENKGLDYKNYYEIIIDIINKIKEKLKKILYIKCEEIIFCPIESIILYYLFETCNDGIHSDIKINELYTIVDIYKSSFDKIYDGHENCLCSKLFNNNIKNNKETDIMKNYLKNHYENIQKIGIIYECFMTDNYNINYLINHRINFTGNNNDFTIYKKYGILGYNDENVYIFYIKPQFNELIYNYFLLESIFDTLLISKINIDNYNYNRFGNKNIISIIFSLDKKKYLTYNWKDLINKNKDVLLNLLKDKLIMKYRLDNKNIFPYFYYTWNKINADNDLKKINIIIDKINNKDKNKDKKLPYRIPDYINSFFQKIKGDIEEEDSINSDKYLNETNFNNFLDKKLINSINKYFE